MTPWTSRLAILFCMAGGSASAQSLTTYGTPGLIEMPTAEVLSDGELTLTGSAFGPNYRYTSGFQILPNLHGSFRYSVIEGFNGPSIGDRYDRSFDLHLRFSKESGYRPALAVGLRDFLGTGLYAGEYLVATKTLIPKLTVTGGIGWGRFAGRDTFRNPLRFLSSRFESRPGRGGGAGGTVQSANWFRGPAALFGGVKWQATDQLAFLAEYSADTYPAETRKTSIDIASPLNLGVEYRFHNGLDLKAFTIGGKEFGAQFNYRINPAKRRVVGGLGEAPQPLVPRERLHYRAWNGAVTDEGRSELERVLSARLAEDGIELHGMIVETNRATLHIQNNRWNIEAQAAGRAARAMANTLDPAIETFRVVFEHNGVPVTTVITQRSDLEELEYDYDGVWRTMARARIADAHDQTNAGEVASAYPDFNYQLGPYTAFSFFDPDNPIRLDVGAELYLAYRPSPGLTFTGIFRYPVVGNVADATRLSDSVIQHVRSDAVLYAQQSDFEMNEATAEYIFRPGKDQFARLTAGYLENMYGGISAEYLWYPTDSRLALGIEANYARQRDFDMLLGFQSYDVLTGHASAYYDLGNGFVTQVDAGRYLAGDWGATFALSREFNNGFKVGGYFTLTDVSYSDFGEGSFDKGIMIEIPLSWMAGQPTRRTYTETIQPVLRDCGARLHVSNRLYDTMRDYRGKELRDGWGRYLR